MPAFGVERNIEINAPAEKVRPAISDLKQWGCWSPWLCMEPEARLSYWGNSGKVGHGHSWEGTLVGAGQLEISAINERTYDFDLTFLKPFKSTAQVQMVIEEANDNATNVTWKMDSSLPFFMFFMVKTMKAMIGNDYMRGLNMMKEYVETGAVASNTKIAGKTEVTSFHYVGEADKCSMTKLSESMQSTMPAAFQKAKDMGLDISGPPGAMYHKVDLVEQHCHYSAFSQVSPSESKDQNAIGQVVDCDAIKVIHTGSYAHLGNAWSAAYAYLRYHKLKAHSTQPAFELYVNDPAQTPAESLITEIYVPIREVSISS